MDEFRSFVDLDDEIDVSNCNRVAVSKVEENIAILRDNIVGSYKKFQTPFGHKPLIYCDWTASGRCLSNVESYVLQNVMPFYGNTHTTTSVTGHQSTCFRHEARQLVAEMVNAKVTGKAANDVVLFCGSGTTGAVDKLIRILGFQSVLSEEISEFRPVVFTSIFEHHSNLIPWREINAKIIFIGVDHEAGVNLKELEEHLQAHGDSKIKIGTFTAASNVTGVLVDTNKVSILLHRYGALAFFDYATAAPYTKIDMNPADHSNESYKDAIFFSGHKFLGGPGCSGVLIVKKWLLPQSNESPSSNGGGGTVFYVTDKFHRYLSNREEREEGGTPEIINDIKIGLVCHLKNSIGVDWIERKEYEINQYVSARLVANNKVVLLGPQTNQKKLPIFSFLIRCDQKFLHFHYVSVLLNDIFGIQCRGGCMCAGPYAQFLLGIDCVANEQFEAALLDKHEVLRPGFTRVSFPYWMTPKEIDYILDAILFVANDGWKFLPFYKYNYKTGEWAHLSRLTKFPERKWLSNFDVFGSESLSDFSQVDSLKRDWNASSSETVLQLIRDDAISILREVEKSLGKEKTVANPHPIASYDSGKFDVYESLKWFVTAEDLRNRQPVTSLTMEGPLHPNLAEDSSSVHATQSTTFCSSLSAYAQIRNEKILRRNGLDINIPRYILLSVEQPSNSLLNSIHTAYNKLLLKQSQSSNYGAMEPKLSSNLVPSQSTECSTGNCFIRPRSVISLETAEGDKVLSGMGHFFPASVSSPTVEKLFVPPKKIMKLVGQAIKDWSMIEEGDRLLLGLSGGKDSLALLHILKALQRRSPVKFEIACATVDPQTTSFDPSPLIPYMQSLGIDYHYLSEPIVDLAKSKLQGDSLCAFCSRFKRGLLYSCCRNYKYNKLVLAQHLDDIVESFMMSALHNGQIRTMKANYTIDAGDIKVIRPLIYVRERATRDFSQQSGLPIINENCPACFEQPKERARMKQLLSQEEAMVPALFYNMKRALLPLMHSDTYETMRRITQIIDGKGSHNSESDTIRLSEGATSINKRPKV